MKYRTVSSAVLLSEILAELPLLDHLELGTLLGRHLRLEPE